MTKKEQQFVRVVWEYYERHGRRSLPWRHTHNPYRILVSEIMLQQTQVERVIPKYREFLRHFPTLKTLAHASLGDVLRVWQGLGYNRRAKMLHACARTVVTERKGRLPTTHSALMELPGIGHYTAGAVMAFAWNQPLPVIETNIRSVYLHHFFTDATDVPDSALMPYIERTLDTTRVREWYYALMDYGVYVKKTVGNPNSRSKHHVVQSTFKGSDREIRGAILRALLHMEMTRQSLHQALPFEDVRVDAQLECLTKEGMIMKVWRGRYALPRE